ncbi:nucleoside triphosphate pyrophosphohydrolase [bacterium]|nr:MAG: nucleoside triphosphate pyrophosphohydrolase [bacterium]
MNKEIGSAFVDLCDIMARLRGPDGCAWDQKQTLSSLKRYLIEECYETIDAMEAYEQDPSSSNMREHIDELGDLLLQIVFQSEIQREKGLFDVADVCVAIKEKLLRRHPHIFGDEAKTDAPGNPHWEHIKQQEREQKGIHRESALDGIPSSFPSLLRASYLGKKASDAGFDWTGFEGAREKLSEEIKELDEAISLSDPKHVQHELGDIMLACVDLARHLGLDADQTLKLANNRFEERFRRMEINIKESTSSLKDLPAEELENQWQRAKRQIG